MNKMTIACLAGIAFAGGLGAWYAVSRYKGRERKRVRKDGKEQEYDEAIAEQLA
ncbi:hypothetical protein [Nitrososphaera sp. AFS]|jgi:hypothetical protein|uniref:hypothetical protein n=1 Tax=Nitrososphaera sp. AFS TaxID=2301191 RepID=UPI0013922AB2|nr:hypothetical protein [Nitrososphaera sp. AFS]